MLVCLLVRDLATTDRRAHLYTCDLRPQSTTSVYSSQQRADTAVLPQSCTRACDDAEPQGSEADSGAAALDDLLDSYVDFLERLDR